MKILYENEKVVVFQYGNTIYRLNNDTYTIDQKNIETDEWILNVNFSEISSGSKKSSYLYSLNNIIKIDSSDNSSVQYYNAASQNWGSSNSGSSLIDTKISGKDFDFLEESSQNAVSVTERSDKTIDNITHPTSGSPRDAENLKMLKISGKENTFVFTSVHGTSNTTGPFNGLATICDFDFVNREFREIISSDIGECYKKNTDKHVPSMSADISESNKVLAFAGTDRSSTLFLKHFQVDENNQIINIGEYTVPADGVNGLQYMHNGRVEYLGNNKFVVIGCPFYNPIASPPQSRADNVVYFALIDFSGNEPTMVGSWHEVTLQYSIAFSELVFEGEIYGDITRLNNNAFVFNYYSNQQYKGILTYIFEVNTSTGEMTEKVGPINILYLINSNNLDRAKNADLSTDYYRYNISSMSIKKLSNDRLLISFIFSAYDSLGMVIISYNDIFSQTGNYISNGASPISMSVRTLNSTIAQQFLNDYDARNKNLKITTIGPFEDNTYLHIPNTGRYDTSPKDNTRPNRELFIPKNDGNMVCCSKILPNSHYISVNNALLINIVEFGEYGFKKQNMCINDTSVKLDGSYSFVIPGTLRTSGKDTYIAGENGMLFVQKNA